MTEAKKCEIDLGFIKSSNIQECENLKKWGKSRKTHRGEETRSVTALVAQQVTMFQTACCRVVTISADPLVGQSPFSILHHFK